MKTTSFTYRDLRNTPAKVFERLASGEPLALIADGTAKAVLIPVHNGDVQQALDAWQRGQALIALASLQESARASGKAEMPAAEIQSEIKAARRARRAKEAEG